MSRQRTPLRERNRAAPWAESSLHLTANDAATHDLCRVAFHLGGPGEFANWAPDSSEQFIVAHDSPQT
jgi:hypothetical protein